MTVVNPKSISGINSITTGSGSDNLLTIHTSDASNTERIRINSSGDVIVGSGITVSPDGDIFATGVTTATTFVGALTGNVTGNVTGNISGGTVAGSTGTFTGDVDIADKIVHTGDTNTAIRFPAADTVTVETAGSERIRINDNGKVLIATSTTSEAHANNDELIIGSSSDDANHGLTIVTPNDHYGTVAFSDGSGGNSQGLLEYNHDGDYMRFYTAASERLRIASDGKVGIGRDDAAYALDIKRAGYSTLRLNNSSETGHGSHDVRIVGGGSNYQNIYFEGSSIKFNTYNGSSVGERFRIRSTGGVTFKGDTADANALDDYEEGIITFAPVNTGISFSSSYKGRYTKIGELVTVSGYLVVSSLTSSGNTLNVQMPFTSAANSEGYYTRGVGAIFYRYVNTPTNQQHLVAYVGGGENYMRFYSSGDSQDWHQTTHSQVSTSTAIYFNICYTTTA